MMVQEQQKKELMKSTSSTALASSDCALSLSTPPVPIPADPYCTIGAITQIFNDQKSQKGNVDISIDVLSNHLQYNITIKSETTTIKKHLLEDEWKKTLA